jgi:hypothetical protein
MFDPGTRNVGASRGDRAAGKLPSLKLANPQAKSTLRFSSQARTPQTAGLLRWQRLSWTSSLSKILPPRKKSVLCRQQACFGKARDNPDGRLTTAGKVRRAIR